MRYAWFGVLLLLLGRAGFLQADTLRVEDLRCEYLANPLGVYTTEPRLGWIVESSQRGQRQTAYQVLVAATPDALEGDRGDLWDSGKVASDETAHVVYAGKPLASRQACYWKVRAWDRDGQPTAWSKPARWEMGLLKADDWTAQWITENLKSDCGAAPVPILRKTVDLSQKPVAAARLFVTALGLYEMHINGQRVGDHILAPEWTDYSKRLRYQVYDVTGLLKPGQNALAALLANGWYSGHIGNGAFEKFGYVPALFAQLEVTYADGTVQRIITDPTWKVHESPILASDFMLGESYDARREVRGWDEPGLADGPWPPAVVRLEAARPLDGQVMQPVRKTGELPARSLSEPKPGCWTFDFGQNMVGVVRIKVAAPAGTKLTLRHAEMLNPDGTIYTTNLRGAPSIAGPPRRGSPPSPSTASATWSSPGGRPSRRPTR
jgi:alpha-L-rhamnosidase